MTAPPIRFAVLIPAYNAADHLGDVLAETLSVVPREDVWVVDDGSTDATASVAERAGVRLVRQRPNQGKAAALLRGFDSTREYDWVVTLDADGQHDPADLPRFAAAAGEAELVVGARPLTGPMPWHRSLGNRFASWLTSRLAGQPVPDSQSGYRLHARKLIDTVVGEIDEKSDGYLFETEILVRAARGGFRLGSVPIAAVYEDEPSHFHATREVPRFLGLFLRLAVGVASGRFARAAHGDD